jgi:hypothetical protein
MVDGMVRAKKNIQKIIRQLKNFRGVFAADNDDSDYFPKDGFLLMKKI